MMKRVISLALAVLMIAALLVACGGSTSSDPVGKYIVKTIDGKTVEDALSESLGENGVASSIEDLLKMVGVDSVEDLITLEIKSDGTAALDFELFSSNMEGTWKQDGNKITITIDGDAAEFTMDGNELSSEMGDQKYVFIKK